MSSQHFVVDGSNLATEGRTTPSLAQLQDAVRAFRASTPRGRSPWSSTRASPTASTSRSAPRSSEAEAAGELVSPPAGAIGRGDGFLLQIADRTGATVLSNDSFQEFHGEYPWLFDDGRLDRRQAGARRRLDLLAAHAGARRARAARPTRARRRSR